MVYELAHLPKERLSTLLRLPLAAVRLPLSLQDMPIPAVIMPSASFGTWKATDTLLLLLQKQYCRMQLRYTENGG